MNDNRSNDGRADRPGAREAQPWHAEDEKQPKAKTHDAPLGTQSFTGGGPEVGLPPKANEGKAERGQPRADSDAPARPDPLAEPRASIGEILGRKP